MTRDEVFKLAEKAGFGCCWEDTDLDCGLIWWSDERPLDEELLRFAALVAAAEREACASICYEESPSLDGEMSAAAIRARGKK